MLNATRKNELINHERMLFFCLLCQFFVFNSIGMSLVVQAKINVKNHHQCQIKN